jgi:hypothetical protein
VKTLKWYGVCAIEAINGAYLVESPSTRREVASFILTSWQIEFAFQLRKFVLRKENLNAHDSSYCIKAIDHCRRICIPAR